MHIPVIVAVLALLATGGTSAFIGSATTAIFGASLALQYADLRAERAGGDEPNDEDDADTDPLNEHAERVDALAVRDLMRIGARIFDATRNDGSIAPQDRKDLAAALDAAQERFAGWIEWAEEETAEALADAAADGV